MTRMKGNEKLVCYEQINDWLIDWLIDGRYCRQLPKVSLVYQPHTNEKCLSVENTYKNI